MNVDEKAWNEWLQHPITRSVIEGLRRGYSAEMRACAAAVGKDNDEALKFAGRVAKTEEMLAVFRIQHEDIQLGSPYDEAASAVDDRPDPATLANWQDSSMGRT